MVYQGQIIQNVQIEVGGEEGETTRKNETTKKNELKNTANQAEEKINTMKRSCLIVLMVVGSVLFRMGRPEKRR